MRPARCLRAVGQDRQCAALLPVENHDRYGRSVATCSLGGTDLNRWMVFSGWALAYRQYSVAYVEAEAEAQAARLGVWDGEFTPPWDWRRNNGDERVATSSGTTSAVSRADGAGCVIKGNITATRRSHLPHARPGILFTHGNQRREG